MRGRNFSSFCWFGLVTIQFQTLSVAGFFLNSGLSATNNGNSKSSSVVPDESLKVLILPGFGNDAIDYTMDDSLVASLEERGWNKDEQIRVLPVSRSDWLQVFLRGALDYKFWLSTADPTRPAFRWYLDLIANEIATLEDDEQIILLGHSAGGWLGRAAIGYGSLAAAADTDSSISNEIDASFIDLGKVIGLVTLGTPNLPPPPSVMDMTRGALRITNEQFPGSYHSSELFYITTVGLSVQGEQQQRKSPLEPTSVKGFAFNSYEAVCGDGTAIGDGVVPQCAGHLDDAIKLDLEGVYHSINRPDNWYGSTGVLDRWHDLMLTELNKKVSKGKKEGMFNPLEFFQFQ